MARMSKLLPITAAGALAISLIAGSCGSPDQSKPAEESRAAEADGPAEGAGSAEAAAPADVPTVTGFDAAVPILMYHAIAPAAAGEPYPELFVPQAEFEEQMRWLEDEGYTGVTLGQVFAAWEDGEPIPEKPVVVSFDDGLRSQYVGAFPMLEALGWPAVLNLKIDTVDQGELDEAAIEDMIDADWEIDAHSLTHPDLTTLDSAALEEEVAGSREEIQRRFDQPADFFCYPAGAYDAEVIAAVKRAGYRGATTVIPGLAGPGEPYELPRVRVEPGDGPDELAAKLGA